MKVAVSSWGGDFSCVFWRANPRRVRGVLVLAALDLRLVSGAHRAVSPEGIGQPGRM